VGVAANAERIADVQARYGTHLFGELALHGGTWPVRVSGREERDVVPGETSSLTGYLCRSHDGSQPSNCMGGGSKIDLTSSDCDSA
jgi:hypothetical protein